MAELSPPHFRDKVYDPRAPAPTVTAHLGDHSSGLYVIIPDKSCNPRSS
ncbi:MAG: hypothetical protein LIO91_08155 [Bacteroidales bacterium]|nr:hypothetical protein [Bacteroidales bacterium]